MIAPATHHEVAENLWVSRADLARLAGLQVTRIDQLRDRFGHPFERGKGRALRVYAPSWLELQRDEQEAARRKTGGSHIERLQRVRAETAELRLDQIRGEVMAVEEVDEIIKTYARKIATAIETIEDISKESAEVMVAALDALEREWEAEAEADDAFRQNGRWNR